MPIQLLITAIKSRSPGRSNCVNRIKPTTAKDAFDEVIYLRVELVGALPLNFDKGVLQAKKLLAGGDSQRIGAAISGFAPIVLTPDAAK